MYHAITEALLKEMDILEQRYANGASLSPADLDMIDKITHALKCLKTYEAMEEPRTRRYEYRRY